MSSLVERISLGFGAGSGAGVLVAALLLAAALVALGLRTIRAGNLPPRRAIVLAALRIALAIAVVLVVLRLELRQESVAVSSAPIAILVDTSASMGVRDQPGGATRLEAARDWLAAHEETLAAVAARTTVDWFAASDGTLRSISAPSDLDAIVPAGGTDLLADLRALAERYPGRPRPEVLLLTDGADHGELARRVAAGGGADAASSLAGLVPAGGAVLGVVPESRGFADRAVDLVARDPVGFLRTEVTVRARVRSTGLPDGDVPVTLLRGDEVVQVRSVRLGGQATAADVTFKLAPSQVGEALYRVQVPLAAGEAVSANNEAPFSVRVVRDRIRVLQVVGRPSWDGRFLRELLKRDPAVDLISFFILRSQWDDTNADVEELSLIPFPVSELFDEKLASFDLVVFQDFDFTPYGIEPYLDVLRRQVVEHGAGLAVIGGDLAFARDYAGPDIASILPVEIGPGAAWDARDVSVALTETGARHPVTRLGGEGRAAADVVSELLPARGFNAGLVPKRDANVLLEAAGGSHGPVVVAGEAGRGRVLVVATDGTWRWSLPMAGRTGTARTYERFWDNAMRWLVRDERSALLLLEADRRVVGPHEGVELRVHVRSESYQPEAGVEVDMRVADAAGQSVVEKRVAADDDGVARLVFEPDVPGLYSVTATAPSRGDAGPIYVECADRAGEMADASVHAEIVEALASATGGKVLSAQDLRAALPLSARREERLESAHVRPLWRTWWAWSLVAGLACTEWWLRRRWGLA